MFMISLREHNRIANQFFNSRLMTDDEQIYRVTRRIVIAQMQNIVYAEYLPTVLGKCQNYQKNWTNFAQNI